MKFYFFALSIISITSEKGKKKLQKTLNVLINIISYHKAITMQKLTQLQIGLKMRWDVDEKHCDSEKNNLGVRWPGVDSACN